MSFDFGLGALEVGIQAYHNYEMQERDQGFTREMFDKENERIEDMNFYNSPAEQMKRFEEAGLNRHLIYGKGTPGNQQQIGKQWKPSVFPTNFKGALSGLNPIGLISAYQDYQQKNANVSKTTAEAQHQALKNNLLNANYGVILQQEQARLNLLNEQATTEQQKRSNMLAQEQLNIEKKRYETIRNDLLEENVNINHSPWQREFGRFLEGMRETMKRNHIDRLDYIRENRDNPWINTEGWNFWSENDNMNAK